jgi:hypothetical protein
MGRFGIEIPKLAEEVGVTKFVIYRLVRRGLVKTIWFGATQFVPHEEVERLKREGAPTPRKGRPRKDTDATPLPTRKRRAV